MAQQGSGNNDALLGSAREFMQAGQNMAQQWMDFLGNAGNPAAVQTPPADPQALADLHKQHMDQQMSLWQSVLSRQPGGEETSKVPADPGDRRFAAPEWRESPIYDYLHQAYLLNTRFVRDLVELIPAADDKARNRMRFLARQISDAMAPSNYAATNPEFIKLAIDTRGQSITDGINNLLADFEKGRISMTDESVFEVGKNIATTEGAVVYENELMQLIQYAPLTPEVGTLPLVVVPPCINKFYIMDLQPDNSLIRYMVAQGNTVFLVSWRNPKEEQGHLTWEDYLEHGPIAALHVAREICGVEQVNALGFCVGGTILSSALAVLKGRGEDIAASLTLMTTLLDFSDTGEIGLFIDERGLMARESTIGKGGLLPARDLQNTFSFLRANDLVWNYVTANYLKGQKPAAVRPALLEFRLDQPAGSVRLLVHAQPLSRQQPARAGQAGDVRPAHRPRQAGDAGLRAGHPRGPYRPVEVVLPEHAHPRRHGALRARRLRAYRRGRSIRSRKNKRSYWVNDDVKTDAAGWLTAAEEKKGSWWSDWADWLKPLAGEPRPARKPGNARYKPIEPAPGRYVKERAV